MEDEVNWQLPTANCQLPSSKSQVPNPKFQIPSSKALPTPNAVHWRLECGGWEFVAATLSDGGGSMWMIASTICGNAVISRSLTTCDRRCASCSVVFDPNQTCRSR